MTADPDIPTLRRLVEAGTPGPWCVEQCGEKCDAPVIGIAYREDDVNCEHPCVGWLRDSDDDGNEIAYYRETIAYELQSCDGASASANAALIVAAVNAIPSLLDRIERAEKALREIDGLAFDNLAIRNVTRAYFEETARG